MKTVLILVWYVYVILLSIAITLPLAFVFLLARILIKGVEVSLQWSKEIFKQLHGE